MHSSVNSVRVQCYDSGSLTRPSPGFKAQKINRMASRQEMDQFLASVERRAFKQAAYAVRDDHTAFDIVQDAMLKLVKSYPDRPAAELPPLFQRILKNAITDHFRRQKIRNLWTTLLSSFNTSEDADGADRDILEVIGADDVHWQEQSAADQVDRSQTLTIIENEIKKLPKRQREAFMMRYWEEMDVAETAAAMGCSQGSVKTHCSRANRSLAKALAARGITL